MTVFDSMFLCTNWSNEWSEIGVFWNLNVKESRKKNKCFFVRLEKPNFDNHYRNSG